MKKMLLLGLVSGLLLFPLLCDGIHFLNYLYPDSKTVDALYTKTFVPGYGAELAFTKDCTKDVSQNGHGWIFVRREYYKCGKVSIYISDLLWGERTEPIDPKLEKRACKGCSL